MKQDNPLFEISQLESEIKEVEELLNDMESSQEKNKSLKKWNYILGFLALGFLATSIFLYSQRDKILGNQVNEDVQVKLDSLDFYKANYIINQGETNMTLADQKIVYSVSLGSFKKFSLKSENLKHLNEYSEDGFNRISIGNYTTLAEAKMLESQVKKLGFKNCLVTARTFGKPIEVEEAVLLSNEKL